MFIFILTGVIIMAFFLSIYCLYAYLKAERKKLEWWKWVLSILWMFCTYIVFGFIGTSIGEGYSGAALRGGAFFMVFVIIGGVLFYRFVLPKGATTKK